LALAISILLLASKAHAQSVELIGWGSNAYEQATPPQSLGAVDYLTRVTAGDYHSCVLRSGDVVCWGWDHDGQATPPP
jgi:hypothetical protein